MSQHSRHRVDPAAAGAAPSTQRQRPAHQHVLLRCPVSVASSASPRNQRRGRLRFRLLPFPRVGERLRVCGVVVVVVVVGTGVVVVVVVVVVVMVVVVLMMVLVIGMMI